MDYRMENKTRDRWVSAHKIWACYDNLVVSLVAGLEGRGIPDSIYTVMEQSWQQGSVTTYPGGRLSPGVHVINTLRWVSQAGFAYIPITPALAKVSLGETTGTWSAINASESDSLLQGDVFTAQLLHDGNANNIAGGYVLAYTGSARKTRKLVRRHPWQVLKNDTACQAIRFSDGAVMAAFFSPGTLHEKGINFETDRPCLLLAHGGKFYLSDPMHTGGQWRIIISGHAHIAMLPPDGTSMELDDLSK
jgi:chondroitin AC lyase